MTDPTRVRPSRSAIGLTLAALFVAGCFAESEEITAPPPPDGKIHVEYWEKWTGMEFRAMKHVVDVFNASQNRIHVDILSESQIEDKTLLATSGGVPPDIAGLYGPNVAQYADDHAVLRLDSLAARAGIKASNYIPVFWNVCTFHGHLYAFPTTPASIALLYNVSEFKKAGLDPANPPQTIEQLDADAAKLTKVGRNGIIQQMGFLPTEPGWWNWAWGYFFGGRLWDGKDRITADDPANVRAWQWIASFSKKYGPENVSTFHSGLGTFSSPQNGFMTGQVAMEIQGVWMYNFIHRFNPKLKWAPAPFPHPSNRTDLADPAIADLDVLCIPKGAKHVQAAMQFIKFVESQRGLEMLCMGQLKFTPLRKVSAHFWRTHPDPYIKFFYHLAFSKNTYATPKLPIWNQYSDELTSALDSVVLLQESPQQALHAVTVKMQAVLDQYNRIKAARNGR